MSDPFAPSQAPEHPRARTGRAPLRAIVVFAVRRLIALFVLPLLVGSVFRLADLTGSRDTPWWALLVGASLSGLVFLPTTAVYVWGRFLAPREDPKALLLGTGERIDREVYRRLAYAGLAERVVGTLLLVAMLVGLVRYGALLACPTGPLLLLGAAYNGYLVFVGWHAAHAMLAHAAGDADGALRHTAPLVRAWIGKGARDAMRVLRATAELRRSDPAAALATLDALENPRAAFGDLLRAQILVGRGDLAPARDLAGRAPANLGERLGLANAEALLALAEGRADDVLARQAEWATFANELPVDVAAAFDLYVAAAHAQRGDLSAARAAFVRSGVDLTERAWLGAAWPAFHALLVRAAGENRPSAPLAE